MIWDSRRPLVHHFNCYLMFAIHVDKFFGMFLHLVTVFINHYLLNIDFIKHINQQKIAINGAVYEKLK